MRAQLRAAGVEVVEEIAEHESGIGGSARSERARQLTVPAHAHEFAHDHGGSNPLVTGDLHRKGARLRAQASAIAVVVAGGRV